MTQWHLNPPQISRKYSASSPTSYALSLCPLNRLDMLILPIAPLLSYLVLSVRGATYGQVDSFSGKDFLSGFVHQAIPDPTHGRV